MHSCTYEEYHPNKPKESRGVHPLLPLTTFKTSRSLAASGQGKVCSITSCPFPWRKQQCHTKTQRGKQCTTLHTTLPTGKNERHTAHPIGKNERHTTLLIGKNEQHTTLHTMQRILSMGCGRA